jgi:hypothetical protein
MGRLDVRRYSRSVIGLVVLVLTSMALLGDGSATGSTSASSSAQEGIGLAQRFVSVGLCDGGPRYRVEFGNSVGGTRVVARLRVIRAGEGARWRFTGMATTTLADGSKVTLIADFGRSRSSRDGVLRLRQATPAGVWHRIHFALERAADGARCRVTVRG